MEIAVVWLLAGCGRFKVERRKFTDWARHQAHLLAHVLIKSSLLSTVFLKVRRPSHSDAITDITESLSRAQERSFAGPQSNRRNRPFAEVRLRGLKGVDSKQKGH